jgi:hypothetical protein
VIGGRLATVATAVLLAGCTSVVDGHGGLARSSHSPSRPAPSSATTAPTLPAGLLRAPASTALGDPVTADLCAAIGLDALRGVGDLTPGLDERQYPPGCSITLRDGATPVVTVSVFAGHGLPDRESGRRKRMTSGRTIYTYRFDPRTGSCRRELKAAGLLLTVDAYPQDNAEPDRGLDCAATDAMADRLAAVLADGAVPRLALAAPSVSELDACKVARRAAVTALPAFARAEVIPQGFGASCELHAGSVFLFFNFAIAAAAHPAGARPSLVAGHQLYATASQPALCSTESTQGRTAAGKYEQVVASATVSGSAPPSRLCRQTAQALARYLTAAGLN